MKWLRRGMLGLTALAALAAAAAAALYWVVGTEGGARWIAARVLAPMTPAVTVGRVRGTLLGGVRLEELRLRLPRDELDVAAIDLDLDRSAALAGRLAFDRVTGSQASYRRLPGEASGGNVPPVPLPIRFAHVTLDALTVSVGGETLEIGATEAAARIEGTTLVLEDVRTSALGADATGSATIGWRTAIELTVDASWSGPVGGVAAAGSATIRGTWPRLDVEHTLAQPFAATTTGAIDFSSAPRVELATRWTGLAWPTTTVVTSPTGELTLLGTLDAYRYEGLGSVVVQERVSGFTVTGSGNGPELSLERLELTPRNDGASAGRAIAMGDASLAARTARVTVEAENFDPAWLNTAAPGRLSGTLAIDARLTTELAASFSDANLRGELRGYPLALSGSASFTAPDRWRFDALRLDSDASFVTLAGTLDSAQLSLDATADVADLRLLAPEVEGSLRGSAALSGSWSEPHARGRVVAANLATAGLTAATLEVAGEIGLADAAPLALDAAATDLRRDALVVARATLTASGTTGSHTVTVEADALDARAIARARGTVTRERLWQGTLEALDIDEPVLGPWQLEEPAALAVGAHRITLGTSCVVHSSRARWCSELDVRGAEQDRLVFSGQNFDLATLRPLLPPALSLGGVYQVSASLFDPTGEPRGALAITGGPTRARIAFGDEQAYALSLDDVRAGMTLSDNRLELTAGLHGGTAGSAELTARIANVGDDASPIDGTVRITWPDLSFLTLLSPELERVGGGVEVDLALAGTVEEPTIDGRASWRDGSLSVPEWGFVVTSIDGTATSGDGRALEFNATGTAGDGTLTLTGQTELDPRAGWPTRLTLRGDGVRAVQLPAAEILASPNLDIAVSLPDVTVQGAIHVPRANIELAELPAQAARPSPDAVVHGTAERARVATPLRIRTGIDLTLGDDVRYSGLNLETTVAGQLRLQTEPDRSASATGTLRLSGTYDAYGQKLALERGQLLFSGPLDNPGLDVRAVRVLDSTTVGVELTGTINAPRTRVFSTPAMNEADALSYLLFGRPVTTPAAGTDAGETSALQAAALSLGLQQALPVVQRIGTSLGLDELTVQSTATDAGALMAGKYLSPKVYIRYSYGLFNRIGGLLLRFKVNERLSIETRSGERKSMDLLYTVEKD
jgi:translocation and assembly module TamB